MHPGQDPLSFTSRKSAANQLPPFELPAPPFNKVPPFKTLQSKHYSGDPERDAKDYSGAPNGSVAAAGNLLTPPNTLLGDGASPSLQQANNSNSADPAGYWSHAQSSAPQYAPYNSPSTSQWIPPRGMYSPSSLDSILRHNGPEAEMINGHPYEMHQLPPFGSSMQLSPNSTLPAMHAAQHQQNMSASAMMNAQSMGHGSSSLSPVSSHEHYHARQHPSQAFFASTQPSPTNPQMAFAPYSNSHHNQPSPLSPSNSSQHRMSPPGNGEHMHPSMASPNSQSPQFQRSYSQFALPAMTGPVMSNIQNPGGQMALVGNLPNNLIAGFNSGHAANMQQMYGGHAAQQPQQSNDRPFKCDQCVQSFNRNHDLKRHKRIHLAVKPFPCGHCDKSFSRKDALKRHILVKGCDKSKGSGDGSSNAKESSSSVSPGGPNGLRMNGIGGSH